MGVDLLLQQVRMQLGAGGGDPVKAARMIYSEAGFSGMYAGLSAAVTRQAVYTTLRVGLYDWIRVRHAGWRKRSDDEILRDQQDREK